jgi:hypothetical protein
MNGIALIAMTKFSDITINMKKPDGLDKCTKAIDKAMGTIGNGIFLRAIDFAPSTAILSMVSVPVNNLVLNEIELKLSQATQSPYEHMPYYTPDLDDWVKNRVNPILCSGRFCTNYSTRCLSGRRWAKRLRKKGWRRSGANWYCKDCSEAKHD